MTRHSAWLLLLGSAVVAAADASSDAPGDANYIQLRQSQRALDSAARETVAALKYSQGEGERWIREIEQKPLRHCTRTKPPEMDAEQQKQWLMANPGVETCMTKYTGELTAVLGGVVNEAHTGKVSDATLSKAAAVADLPVRGMTNRPVAEAAPVNPWGGTGAKIEHTASGVFLDYTDTGGTSHHYAVVRPKFVPASMFKDDTGGWIYVAPDRKSGTTFQVGAGGGVSGTPLNPLQIPMVVGQ